MSDWSSDVCSSDLLLREPSLTQAGIAKRLELESATIGQAVAGLCGKGLMERRRAKTDGRAWQLILTQELDRLLPQLRESAESSAERRGGTECVGTCRSRWSPTH